MYNVNALQATQSHIFVDTLAVVAQNKLFSVLDDCLLLPVVFLLKLSRGCDPMLKPNSDCGCGFSVLHLISDKMH